MVSQMQRDRELLRFHLLLKRRCGLSGLLPEQASLIANFLLKKFINLEVVSDQSAPCIEWCILQRKRSFSLKVYWV